LAVTAKDVTMVYKTASGQPFTALGGINFTIEQGEFIVFLGPSGCGKSTMLNIIAGLDSATAGSVEINGTAVREPGRDKAFVFQEPALFPWLTVLENVMFAIKDGTKAEKTAKAQQYLELVHLGKFKSSYPHQLSGGMKQRVSIARALATESELLLMDEPFAALDEQTRIMLQVEVVNIWKQTGKTVVFVTHNIREAVYLADRIFLFGSRPGRIKREFNINLSRPRVMNSPAMVDMEAEILECLKEEIEKVVQEQLGEEYILETGRGGHLNSGDMGSNI